VCAFLPVRTDTHVEASNGMAQFDKSN